MTANATLPMKSAPSDRHTAALAGVAEWKQHAHAALRELASGGRRLLAEVDRTRSPLRDAVSVRNVAQFVSAVEEAETSLLQAQLEPEVEFHLPDPLAGL